MSAVQEKQIRQIRAELGLDRSFAAQYVAWLGDLAHGNFGYSYSQRRPVNEILAERFPRSMELAVLTLGLATLWSVPLGVVSAVRQNTWADYQPADLLHRRPHPLPARPLLPLAAAARVRSESSSTRSSSGTSWLRRRRRFPWRGWRAGTSSTRRCRGTSRR